MSPGRAAMEDGERKSDLKVRLTTDGLWEHFIECREALKARFLGEGTSLKAAARRAWIEAAKLFTPAHIKAGRAGLPLEQDPHEPDEPEQPEELVGLAGPDEPETPEEEDSADLDWAAGTAPQDPVACWDMVNWVAAALGREARGKEVRQQEQPDDATWGMFKQAKAHAAEFWRTCYKLAEKRPHQDNDHERIKQDARRSIEEIDAMLAKYEHAAVPG